MENDRRLLRHYIAALAYRTRIALREAPREYEDFRAAPGTRTPRELVRHMSGVLNYALGLLTTPRALLEDLPTYAEEVARFHSILDGLVTRLADEFPIELAERLLQGPFSDAMTHAGQLTMLRRLAGSPVPPQNYFDAAVSADNVGPHQPEPVSPDREWPEAPAGWKPPQN